MGNSMAALKQDAVNIYLQSLRTSIGDGQQQPEKSMDINA
jgi:hypothetical protein